MTIQISSELWLLLSYKAKKNVKICEVQDLKSNSGKTLIKEVTDFTNFYLQNVI